MKRRYLFDIETDCFLPDCTKVHCIILYDLDKDELIHVPVEEAIYRMEKAALLVGHNIIKFDLPVLKKLYNFTFKGDVFDTIIATRLLFPDI